MSLESDKAVSALFESEDYVNKKACESIAQSLYQDFQMLMFVAVFQAFLAKTEDPEGFLSPIVTSWRERSESFLKSEAKRFQELIFKSSATDGHKLSSDIQSIFTNYSTTLTTAYTKANNAVDEIVSMLLNKPKKSQTENKESKNDQQ